MFYILIILTHCFQVTRELNSESDYVRERAATLVLGTCNEARLLSCPPDGVLDALRVALLDRCGILHGIANGGVLSRRSAISLRISPPSGRTLMMVRIFSANLCSRFIRYPLKTVTKLFNISCCLLGAKLHVGGMDVLDF